jgi:hypothetical protein
MIHANRYDKVLIANGTKKQTNNDVEKNYGKIHHITNECPKQLQRH